MKILIGFEFNLHILRADHKAGGHAIDCFLSRGCLELAAQRAFQVDLPETSDTDNADQNDPGLARMIQKAEE